MLRLPVFILCLLLNASSVGALGQAPHNENASGEARKAVVISKPKPHYPKAARKQHIEATVILRAVFRSTGEVTDVKLDKVVPDNIPEELVKQFADECIKAAYKIKFEPAVKNGHPVSMYTQLEYYFSGR